MRNTVYVMGDERIVRNKLKSKISIKADFIITTRFTLKLFVSLENVINSEFNFGAIERFRKNYKPIILIETQLVALLFLSAVTFLSHLFLISKFLLKNKTL